MKYLMDNLSYLDELTSQERLDHLLVHYRKVPAPIVEYALCKHYSACQMIEEFSDVDLNESSIFLKHFSTHQIFEEIDYGSFCSFRDESEYYYHTAMENNLEEYHIRNGSWRAPIVVVKRGNIYKALDGNNRLRMLRCYIRWSNKSYSEMHDVYVIEKSDNYLGQTMKNQKFEFCTCSGGALTTGFENDWGYWDVCSKCGKRIEDGYHSYNHYDGEDHEEFWTTDGDIVTYEKDD